VRPLAAVGLSVAAVLAAAGVVVFAAGGSAVSGHGQASHPPVVAAAAPPVPTVSAPPAPVGAAVPTQFTISGPAFHVDAQVCAMPYAPVLDPPGEQHHTICWVRKPLGVAPASDSKGTSYLLGHSWAEDAAEVLNPLSIYALDHLTPAMSTTPASSGFSGPTVSIHPVDASIRSYKMTLRTSKGTLTYQVSRAFTVAKPQLPWVATVWDGAPRNRVVLITCGVHDGQDVDVNLIVVADLVSYRAAG
jgi:hypothetical protein